MVYVELPLMGLKNSRIVMKAGDWLNEVEQKSKFLLAEALRSGASDIHFIPRVQDALIRFRIGGILADIETLSKRTTEKLVSHFKFLAGMDIGEKRRPQNGALDFESNPHFLNLRLSTLPTPFGESLAIRVLPQKQTFSISELSLFPQMLPELLSLIDPSDGLILVTGPTGSGKTTLLYSLLYESAKRYDRQIVTFEDPIEIKSDRFVQMEVNEKAGLTYAEGFRAILRHDPDVIMVGEIRDAETARLAVRASMTGHLVFATLHTRNTFGAVYRLLEFGIPLSYLEQTLTAVLSQRLVPLICPYCGSNCHPECRVHKQRNRLGIYEMLYGQQMRSFLTSLRETPEKPYRPKVKTIEDLMKRGRAFGYLPDKNSSRRADRIAPLEALEEQR